MKQDYSFGQSEIESPLGPRRPNEGQHGKPGKRKKNEFHFDGFEDTPPKVKYQSLPNGFRIHSPAPNYGKAAGALIPMIIAGFVAVYGPDAEKVDPFVPRLVCGIIMGIFLLAGIYQLLRRHELVIKDGKFRISEGFSFLKFSRKGKISQIKSAWVDNKIRSLHTEAGGLEDGEYNDSDSSRNRFFYLAVRLKDKTILHTMEGSRELTLNYMLYAIRTVVMKQKK